MGSEFESYTEWLIEEIESQADWRAREVEEFREDERNLRSSQALRNLAARMKGLSADNPKIQELWRLWFGTAVLGQVHRQSKALDLIEIVSEELDRYGFYSDEDGDPKLFLDSLISQSRRKLMITQVERKLEKRSLSKSPERAIPN